MTLKSSDHGKTVEVPLGESITIRLPENPTTGYRWAVDSITQSHLTIDEGHFVPAAGSGVGGGGYREMVVHTKQEGVGEVRLKLRQPWEDESAVSDRFEVRVVVRSNFR